MHIGNLTLTNHFILAPLAGYTDLPFRLLCREHGAALCYSEMISCHGLAYRQWKTIDLTRTVPAERPVAMQLFGADPGLMGEAATILSELPIDLIDINMGCPVKKVVKKGAGSALMKTPGLAGTIIEQVCRNTSLPVTVKMRSGWQQSDLNAVEFAKMAEGSGAAAVAVHARTTVQGFSGTADWQQIARVKEAVSIPVIGNGDINSYQDGLAMLAATGCDAVMVGRAALGNPWIFSPLDPPATVAGRAAVLKRHLELITEFGPIPKNLASVKNQAGRYFKGLPGAAHIRQRIYNATTYPELLDLVATTIL